MNNRLSQQGKAFIEKKKPNCIIQIIRLLSFMALERDLGVTDISGTISAHSTIWVRKVNKILCINRKWTTNRVIH